AQEVLGMVDEVLRSGEEITQLRRMRDAGHVHTALPEEPLVERGMAGDVGQGSPQLPGLDAVEGRGRARSRSEAVRRLDGPTVDQVRHRAGHTADDPASPYGLASGSGRGLRDHRPGPRSQ